MYFKFQVCKCEEIRLGRSECARAYLKDHCTNCNALFTTMRQGQEWKKFPVVWSSFVRSLVVKEGCDVSFKYAHSENNVEKISSTSSRIVEVM